MKSLRWIWFFIIMIFCIIPRFIYAIKIMVPKEPEKQDGYDEYMTIADAIKEMNKENIKR